MINGNLSDQINVLLMVGVGITILCCWIYGLIGLIRTESIKATYGSVISGGWGLLRMFRFLLTIIAIQGFCTNNLNRLAGYYVKLTGENIFWYTVCILLHIFIWRNDKKRFYTRCDRATAKRIISAERQLGYSILTRLSLIITIPTMAVAFALTDTSEYYLDKRDGRIYRVKDEMSL